ncbi:MAG: Gfo/Idh/MocA family protein [Roseobacter sp.]
MKVALIGCGFFAQNQLQAWRDIKGVDVVALCDTDRARLVATGEEFGIDRQYIDATALFHDGGFDIVDIATTVQSHRALVEMAAAHKKHIICQKPFAKNMADARAMVRAVEGTGKILMVHENFRWQSAVRAVIKEVRRGTIGNPFFGRVSFRSAYDVFSGQPYLAEGERFIIEDLGIHILDISRALFGDVARVSATTRRINPTIKGEDVATMLLDHISGVSSVVDCSYATQRQPETFPESMIEVDGEKGTIRLDAGYKMTLHTHEMSETRDLTPPLLHWASSPWHNIQESVRIIQQHFVDCLLKGTQPETSGGDNLQTLALVEAAYLSAAECRTVETASI